METRELECLQKQLNENAWWKFSNGTLRKRNEVRKKTAQEISRKEEKIAQEVSFKEAMRLLGHGYPLTTNPTKIHNLLTKSGRSDEEIEEIFTKQKVFHTADKVWFVNSAFGHFCFEKGYYKAARNYLYLVAYWGDDFRPTASHVPRLLESCIKSGHYSRLCDLLYHTFDNWVSHLYLDGSTGWDLRIDHGCKSYPGDYDAMFLAIEHLISMDTYPYLIKPRLQDIMENFLVLIHALEHFDELPDSYSIYYRGREIPFRKCVNGRCIKLLKEKMPGMKDVVKEYRNKRPQEYNATKKKATEKLKEIETECPSYSGTNPGSSLAGICT